MRSLIPFLATVLLGSMSSSLRAQPGTISTFLGAVPDRGAAAEVGLINPSFLAVDRNGTVYVSESHSVTVISPDRQARPLIRWTGFGCEGDNLRTPYAFSPWQQGLVSDGQGIHSRLRVRSSDLAYHG